MQAAIGRRAIIRIEESYRTTCTVQFFVFREQMGCMETEFKSWRPRHGDEARANVVAVATFQAIAQDLQKQVDAGSLSDRAAMNELEGGLLDILYDQPTGRQQRFD
jgi:hypothetical protein